MNEVNSQLESGNKGVTGQKNWTVFEKKWLCIFNLIFVWFIASREHNYFTLL